MNTLIPLKYLQAWMVALLLVVVGSGCMPALPTPVQVPVVQTVQVSRLVTRDVTQEVTRVVEVPVTVTPTETLMYTLTPSLSPTITGTPTLTPTSGPPVVTIQGLTDCLYGPGSDYLYKTSLLAASQMEVVGRNMDGSWLYVQEVHGWNPCWIPVEQSRFDTGDIKDVPFVTPRLPYSDQYNPPDAKAQRKGNEVTISWPAVWMSSDDYRGYLIEAWVCQGGTQVFLPVNYDPPLASNTGTLSVTVTDESGCDAPSSGHIYSAGKRGYSASGKIFWPVYQVTATP